MSSGSPSGVVDFTTADTTPGSRCVFAPPEGTNLTAAQYIDLMRKRYRQDVGVRAHLACFSRHIGQTRFVGPFAEQARAVLEGIVK